ncbi:MAG: HAD family hydrolase [Anaerolineae bacterium]|nr:HAD family hydrolase [Anaerolineae bacterium]
MTQIILTDLDNTIYNWVDYFAPSFRGMVHALSKRTGIAEDNIIANFKRVYGQEETLEYAFSVQKLEMCRGKSEDEIKELVRVAKGAFSRVRGKNLKPYPNVKETLVAFKKENIPIIGVTNAPIFQAERRLRQLRLDGLFYGLVGWQGRDVPEDYPWTKEIKQRAEQGKYPTRITEKWSLTPDKLKPNSFGYLKVIEKLGVDIEQVYCVGDSLHKDIKPALELGAIGIWARYGQSYKPENFETLLAITYWSQERISAVYEEKVVTPTFIIDDFSELRDIVRGPQLYLPGFR